MSWRSRSALAGLALLGASLAGCGFHPLYAEQTGGGTLDPVLASVEVPQVHDRLGQALTNYLRDGFNPTSAGVAKRYRLEVSLIKSEYDQAIRSDGTASYTNVHLTATYVLRQLGDGKAVITANAVAHNGFDVLDNQYGNTIAGQSLEMRAVRDLSDQIQSRVAIYFQQTAAKP